MPKVSVITGVPVLRPDGKRIGMVLHVLFHASEPRVVGFEVERPLAVNLFSLPSRFLPFEDATLVDDGYALQIATKRLPSPGATAKEAGVDWDTTVIWLNMSVRTESGEELGRVGDVVFGDQTATVKKVVLTEGAATDAGVGKRTLTGASVIGFDGADVVVKDRIADQQTSGGAATVAGVGTAVAKEVIGRAAGNAAREGGKLAAKAAKRWKKSAKEWKELMSDE